MAVTVMVAMPSATPVMVINTMLSTVAVAYVGILDIADQVSGVVRVGIGDGALDHDRCVYHYRLVQQ